jgi:hypothetical protein
MHTVEKTGIAPGWTRVNREAIPVAFAVLIMESGDGYAQCLFELRPGLSD